MRMGKMLIDSKLNSVNSFLYSLGSGIIRSWYFYVLQIAS